MVTPLPANLDSRWSFIEVKLVIVGCEAMEPTAFTNLARLPQEGFHCSGKKKLVRFVPA